MKRIVIIPILLLLLMSISCTEIQETTAPQNGNTLDTTVVGSRLYLNGRTIIYNGYYQFYRLTIIDEKSYQERTTWQACLSNVNSKNIIIGDKTYRVEFYENYISFIEK